MRNKKQFSTDEKKKQVNLTRSDLNRIEIALRLREETCEENGETSESKLWYKLRQKVLFFLGWEE